jgi:uncharacterized RDD family membrane protein YckC
MNGGAERVILTPEHVEIRLVPAGLGSRFLALIVDSTLSLGVAWGVTRLLAPLLSAGAAQTAQALIFFVVTWSYHVGFEVRAAGRSPGKRLVGLRVVDGRGLPIRLEQSFVRNIVRVLDFAPLFYGLGGLVALVDPYGRRLGDLVADTLVIRESRQAEPLGRLLPLRDTGALRSPALARVLRHRISLEERELLLALCLRADRLEPTARYDLMEHVADWYRGELGLDEPSLSGENLVRSLTAVLFASRLS